MDRLADLANLGAEQAAESFTQLVGRTIRTDAPTVIDADSSGGAGRSDEKISTSSTGVFFEFEGCLEALVGIVFPASASEALVRRVIGIESGELMPTMIESALMEVGNILASHVASGIADALKSRLLPSIPSLAMENSEQALESFIEGIAGPNAPRIESAFSDDGGEIRGRFVLVPTQVAHWAPLQQGSDSRDL